MRILIIDGDYGQFLEHLYNSHPGLETTSFDNQSRIRAEQFFGIAQSYAKHLERAGNEARTIYVNNEHAQLAWAREYGRRELRERASAGSALSRVGWKVARRVSHGGRPPPGIFEAILRAQVRDYAPDVLMCLNPRLVDPRLITEFRNTVGLLVGQHSATTLPNIRDLACYDLFLSSFPPTVDALRAEGIDAERFRLGFDPDVLAVLGEPAREYELSFVGSLFPGVHDSRVRLLESIASRVVGLRIWSTSVDNLEAASPIRDHYVGEAWGVDMYRVFARSKIVINHHGDIAGFANNSRLYEATGCGALLVTDGKQDLSELFEVGFEVVAYEDVDECIELIERALADEGARVEIAQRGQQRTLCEHTYRARMEELVHLITSRPHRATTLRRGQTQPPADPPPGVSSTIQSQARSSRSSSESGRRAARR